MKKISVIITCFNESENIIPLYERLTKIFQKINYTHEFIFVDNASTDASYAVFEKLAKKDKNVKVILMSRNFGSPQPSFIAGIQASTGNAVFLLHGDIQDPPELLPKFIKKWENGNDVVYGVHKKRKGYNAVSNIFYRLFYFLLNKLSYIDIPLDAGDFCLMDKKIIPYLLEMKEYDYYLRGLRSYIGFKQIGIEYIRDPRIHGNANTNFIANFWWAKTIIINFSIKPLEWISQIAFVVTICTFLFMIINVILVLFINDSPRGIPLIVILILFLGSIQLLGLAIIAEYLAKIFIEVKGRPKFIIQKTLNIQKNKKLLRQ